MERKSDLLLFVVIMLLLASVFVSSPMPTIAQLGNSTSTQTGSISTTSQTSSVTSQTSSGTMSTAAASTVTSSSQMSSSTSQATSTMTPATTSSSQISGSSSTTSTASTASQTTTVTTTTPTATSSTASTTTSSILSTTTIATETSSNRTSVFATITTTTGTGSTTNTNSSVTSTTTVVVTTTTVTSFSGTQTSVAVTVSSTPFSSGAVFIDGTPITTPSTFYWQMGSSHNFFIAGSVSGYPFQYWQIDGAVYTYSSNFNYVADASHTFNAIFNGQMGPMGGVPITINSLPFTGFNLIQVDGNPINAPYVFYWQVGSTHVIAAAPDGLNGVQFQFWSMDGLQYASASSFIYQVDGPHTFTAIFAPPGAPVPEFPNGEVGIVILAITLAITAMRRRRKL